METQSEQDAGDWLTVTQAAARLGVSVRAVQKRCQSGKLKAQRVETAQGVRWEVDGRELGRERTNEPANIGREPTNADAQSGAKLDANPRTIGREPANQSSEPGREQDANRVAELKEEVRFLRAQVEAHARTAAEATAAVRELTRALNQLKALPSPSAETEQIEGHSVTPESHTTKDTTASSSGPQWPAKREMRPLWRVILGLR